MSAIGQKFHAECFTCFQCHRPICSGLFHLENGEPYCDEGMLDLQLASLICYRCLWSALAMLAYFSCHLCCLFVSIYCFLALVALDWFLVVVSLIYIFLVF